MPRHIRVGVLTHAEGAHLDAYFNALAKIPEAESVVLADPSGRTVAQAKKLLGAKLQGTCKDRADLLKKSRPALALVTMEAAQAPPAIEAALDAGCHVLSEKPGCVRAADFDKLVRKAQQKHLHLMLALANRVHPAAQEARRLVQKGLL